jgi:hypothetical protein
MLINQFVLAVLRDPATSAVIGLLGLTIAIVGVIVAIWIAERQFPQALQLRPLPQRHRKTKSRRKK